MSDEKSDFERLLHTSIGPETLVRIDYERKMESLKWLRVLDSFPGISLPAGCTMIPVPPYCGAVVRFIVKVPDTSIAVSVYLDCYNNLGFFGAPYWEIYPRIYKDSEGKSYEDTDRCLLEDIAGLSKAIACAIEEQKAEHEREAKL